MAICFCGVLMICLSQGAQQNAEIMSIIGVIVGIVCAWLTSLSSVCQRRLRGINFAVTNYWNFLIGTFIGVILVFCNWSCRGVGMKVHS